MSLSQINEKKLSSLNVRDLGSGSVLDFRDLRDPVRVVVFVRGFRGSDSVSQLWLEYKFPQ